MVSLVMLGSLTYTSLPSVEGVTPSGDVLIALTTAAVSCTHSTAQTALVGSAGH